MTCGQLLANAAAELLGTPFKLHGRNHEYGLDCIGLVSACLKSIGAEPVLPRGYRLRNTNISHWLACAPKSGLRPVSDRERPGDIGLFEPSPNQHHLMIVEAQQVYIHAHAGLKMVIREATPTPYHFAQRWRIATDFQD